MKKPIKKATVIKSGGKDKKVTKAMRDNVLGRRPSKSDPLGEQPGSVAKNQELDKATASRKPAAAPARRAKSKKS